MYIGTDNLYAVNKIIVARVVVLWYDGGKFLLFPYSQAVFFGFEGENTIRQLMFTET